MAPFDLIVLPFHDWKKIETEGPRGRDGHLLAHFRRSPRVGKILLVDRPISLPERLASGRPVRCRSGAEAARRGRAILSRIDERLYVADFSAPDLLSPLILRRDWWDKIFREPWVAESILWAAREAEISAERRALLCWSPLSTGVFGKLGERALVFDAIDNWCDHPVIRDGRGWIWRGYEKAAREAGALICNSASTAEFLGSLGGKPRLTRNGADLDAWDPARARNGPAPDDLARLPRPWIGYSGRLAARTDVELIARLSALRPEASIILVGPMLDAAWHAPLQRLANVHFLGDKPYAQLPGYVARFDVACIFHRPETVRAMDPTKLYEYLAAELPVVSTPVAGLAEFSDAVEVAASAEEFNAAIGRALARRAADPAAFARGRVLLEERGFTWAARAEEFLDAIESAFAAPPRRA